MRSPIGVVNTHAAASCELAARHRCDLSSPASSHRDTTRGRLAGAREKPVRYERGGDRAVNLLGANETGTATSGLLGLVEVRCRCHARTYLWFHVSVAHLRAEQEHALEKSRKRMPVEDSYIADTAKRYGLTIATNEQDFRRPGVKVFNPFTHPEVMPNGPSRPLSAGILPLEAPFH